MRGAGCDCRLSCSRMRCVRVCSVVSIGSHPLSMITWTSAGLESFLSESRSRDSARLKISRWPVSSTQRRHILQFASSSSLLSQQRFLIGSSYSPRASALNWPERRCPRGLLVVLRVCSKALSDLNRPEGCAFMQRAHRLRRTTGLTRSPSLSPISRAMRPRSDVNDGHGQKMQLGGILRHARR